MHTLIQHVFQRRKRLKERSKQPNPTGETQMAQVTYRGIKYNTNDKKQTNSKKVQETYRGIKFEKEVVTA